MLIVCSPSSGLVGGDTITINGTLFSPELLFVTVAGTGSCDVLRATETEVVCTLPDLAGGSYTPVVTTLTGDSKSVVEVEYSFSLDGVSSISGMLPFLWLVCYYFYGWYTITPMASILLLLCLVYCYSYVWYTVIPVFSITSITSMSNILVLSLADLHHYFCPVYY